MKGLQVSYRQDDNDKYVGFVTSVPNIICQGDTLDQLKSRLMAATKKYADYLAKKEIIVAKKF